MHQSILLITCFLTDKHVQLSSPPLGTYQNSNIKIPGHKPFVLERAGYLKATTTCGDIFVVAW